MDARREVDELLAIGPPSVRWKLRTGVLAEDPASRSGGEHVRWGGASRTRPNQWVTADALTVLSAAGRLDGISKGSGRPSR